MNHIYNLKLSPVRNRIKFSIAENLKVENVPDTDVSKDIPYTLNQLNIGSCVFNACDVALAHVDFKLHPATGFAKLSVLAPYYDYREDNDCVSQDTGSSGYEYCRVAKEHGIGLDSLWPYNIRKFKTKPSKQYYASAIKNQLLEFQQIPVRNKKLAIDMIRMALYKNKVGVPVGITIFEDFESNEVQITGNYFKSNFKNALGGHEVYVVGSYRNTPVPFIRFLNSWGENVGKKGLNGLRGYYDVAETVFARILLEANVLTKVE